MAKVVLISPPYVKQYMRNARCDFVSLSASSWFPIWLGQAGAWLEGKGHQTRLLDAQVQGLNGDQAMDAIKDFDADIVAVYTGRLSEDNDVAFGDAVAATGRTVVFVGPYTSVDPDKVLRKAKRVRLAIRKEFDLPLEELASGLDPLEQRNFHVKDQETGAIQANPPRNLYRTDILDQFPLTSEYFHRQLDYKLYKTPSELYPFLDIMSGRGCAWGKCSFCLWVHTFVDGSVYNLRSIDHFMEEFEYVTRFMPDVQSIMIQDDMLTNKRARQISEAILERGYKIRWSCYAKPNSKLTQETLDLMAKSGCLNLHVGFESGDDDVLKHMDKGATVADALEFGRMVHKAGLQIHGDFAMGHFGDSKESMNRTLELAKAINPHTAQFQIMIPFEGTPFWDEVQAKGTLSKDGKPSYESVGGASTEEIEAFAKAAYRDFYISGRHLKKVLNNPREYLFNRLDQYIQAIPAVTWRKWVR
ncbi:MAG: B12-binding domain-containing radical SAM protein [Rhodospirillaceae bacterium]